MTKDQVKPVIRWTRFGYRIFVEAPTVRATRFEKRNGRIVPMCWGYSARTFREAVMKAEHIYSS